MAIWAYCLMPNHVHIIAVPEDVDGLRRTFRFVHRHYAGYINARLRTIGHLWHGRFARYPMDDAHLMAAVARLALNPRRCVWPATGLGWVLAAMIGLRFSLQRLEQKHLS